MKKFEPYYDPNFPPDGAYTYGREKISVRKMILKTQKNKSGEVRIYVEVYQFTVNADNILDKKSRRINTGIWVLPGNWSKSKQEVLPKDPNSGQKNYTINLLYGKVEDYLNNRNNQVYQLAYNTVPK